MTYPCVTLALLLLLPASPIMWPRHDHVVPYTHWAVYVGTRYVRGGRWIESDDAPESVVHLWGRPDSATRDISSDAVGGAG